MPDCTKCGRPCKYVFRGLCRKHARIRSATYQRKRKNMIDQEGISHEAHRRAVERAVERERREIAAELERRMSYLRLNGFSGWSFIDEVKEFILARGKR